MELKSYFIQDSSGQVLPGATCYLYNAGTDVSAAGVVDAKGNALANPFASDSTGLVQFRAPNGDYDLRVTTSEKDYRLQVQCLDTQEGIQQLRVLVAQGEAVYDKTVNALATEIAKVYGTLANNTERSKNVALLGYLQAGEGAVGRTLQEKIDGVSVDVEDFGAKGDGTTDDTRAFQYAIHRVRVMGGGTVHAKGRYLIDNNLFVEDYVNLHGDIDNPDELLDGVQDYDSKRSLLFINPTKTISIESGASAARMLVMRKGLDLPFKDAAAAAAGIAAFAGTAFTGKGAGVSLHNMLVLGFQWLYKSANLERPRIHKVYGDCTNGIDIASCYDIADVTENEMWPYTTTHQSWTTGALNTRNGVAFRFSNVGDWNRFNRCFSYGYLGGFEIDSCDNVVLMGCGADHYSDAVNTTSIGFNIKGTSKNPVMIGCQSAAQYRAVVMNSTAANGNVLQMIGCQFWDHDDVALKVLNGYVLAHGCVFRGGTVAADVDSASLGAHFSSCRFDGQKTRPVSGSGLNKVSSSNNTFVNTTDDTLGSREVRDNQFNDILQSIFTGSVGGTNLLFRKARGTLAAPTALVDGGQVLSIQAIGYNGSSYTPIALIRAQVQGTVGTTTQGGGWIISTTANSGVNPADRWGFMQNGNLQPITDNAVQLGASGARVSSIWAANGTIQTSDERFKGDIQDSVLGLGFVQSLRPVSYKWLEGGRAVVRQVYHDNKTGEEIREGEEVPSDAVAGRIITETRPGTRTHWGFIAQEVKRAVDAQGVDFAGWVLSDPEDETSQQALRYDQFIAPLIKAVQELADKNAELETRVSALEG